MIGKLTGTFGGGSAEGRVIIEVGGVGYLVRVPLATQTSIRTKPIEVSLFIYTAVREDAIDLYGFLTEEELAFFRQLLSVSGIGPKSALGILNIADVGTLKRGVARGDASILTKVFGIGKKSAERIVVELRDKLAGETSSTELGVNTEDGEVLEALIALGYSAEESRKAVRQVDPSITGVKARLSAALKVVGSQAK
jgi:Holliday junction DNA helicase RuvA